MLHAAGWISDAPSGSGLEVRGVATRPGRPVRRSFRVRRHRLLPFRAPGSWSAGASRHITSCKLAATAIGHARQDDESGLGSGSRCRAGPEGRVHMPRVRVAAVQASYVLMDQQATLDKVAELTAKAAVQGAQLVVFPEVFVPGTPIWIDTDRKSTRLNSSHLGISYAVFCLKKKKQSDTETIV